MWLSIWQEFLRAVGLLGDSAGWCCVLLGAWKLSKPSTPKLQNWSRRFTRRSSAQRWAIYWLFAGSVVMVLIWAGNKNRYPIETHHHVQVLRKLGPNTWEMSDDELGTFVYQGCPDFPNESVIWAGYIATRATWQEQGKCKSIRDTGLAFIWERDEQGNVKEVSDAIRTAR